MPPAIGRRSGPPGTPAPRPRPWPRVGREPVEHRSGGVDRVRPIQARALWAARPSASTSARRVPLQPPSTRALVGSHSTANVAGEQLGALAADPGQPVQLGLDLLVVVEDPGDVATGRGEPGGDGQLDRDPALHVARAPAPSSSSSPSPVVHDGTLAAIGTVSRWPAMTTRSSRSRGSGRRRRRRRGSTPGAAAAAAPPRRVGDAPSRRRSPTRCRSGPTQQVGRGRRVEGERGQAGVGATRAWPGPYRAGSATWTTKRSPGWQLERLAHRRQGGEPDGLGALVLEHAEVDQ